VEAIDTPTMRRLNAAMTLRELVTAIEPVTMGKLASATSLSRRTIELILTDLMDAGWVTEVLAPTSGAVGRPARHFSLLPERVLLGAAQFDSHTCRAIITDVRGRVLGRHQIIANGEADPDRTLKDIERALDAALDSSGRQEALSGVGLAVPGRVDDQGTVIDIPTGPSWAGYPAGKELAARLRTRVAVDNDGNMAVLGEQWLGSARDASDFAWIVAGDRNGAGFLINNRVHRGFLGSAGEIMHVDDMGLVGLDGNPFGALVSPDTVARQAALDVVERVRQGDVEADRQFRTFVEPLANVLAILSWTVAPPLIVLGGGLAAAADELIPRLRKRLDEVAAPPIELRASALPQDASMLGAIRAARRIMHVDFADAFVEA
jgi:predicted NBD/HSP70 family sugar kinase